MGEGPLTGRRLGHCSGEAAGSGYDPGFFGYRRRPGRGLGPRAGRRFGGQGRSLDASRGPGYFGWAYGEDVDALEVREKYLEDELKRIRSLREQNPGDEA